MRLFRMPTARTVWIAGMIAALLLLVALRYEPGHGLTTLTQFDVVFQPRQVPALATIPHHVRSPTGFDGQFYCQLALDPLLLDPHTPAALDIPAFRARRILVPWLAYLLGAGQPYWIVHLYPLLNVGFWLLLLALLLRVVPGATGLERAAITAILFSTGALESVRLAVTDLPASYFAVLPALLGAAGIGGIAALAAASLTRETGILAIASFYAAPSPVQRPLWQRFALAGAALVPVALWNGYIFWRWDLSFTAGGTLGLPFVHMAAALWANLLRFLSELSPGGLGGVATIAGLLVQTTYLWTHRRPADPLWRVGVAFSVLMVFLGGFVWAIPNGACRFLLPLTIAFNLQLVRAPQQPHRRAWFVAGNAYSLFGVLKFLTYAS